MATTSPRAGGCWAKARRLTNVSEPDSYVGCMLIPWGRTGMSTHRKVTKLATASTKTLTAVRRGSDPKATRRSTLTRASDARVTEQNPELRTRARSPARVWRDGGPVLHDRHVDSERIAGPIAVHREDVLLSGGDESGGVVWNRRAAAVPAGVRVVDVNGVR